MQTTMAEYSFFVTIGASGVELTSEITINIIDVAETAIFETTDFSTQENSLASFAFDAIASNGSELNYSIVGGDDFSAIELSSDMTQFNLLDLPNFEAPTDFDGTTFTSLLFVLKTTRVSTLLRKFE